MKNLVRDFPFSIVLKKREQIGESIKALVSDTPEIQAIRSGFIQLAERSL